MNTKPFNGQHPKRLKLSTFKSSWLSMATFFLPKGTLLSDSSVLLIVSGTQKIKKTILEVGLSSWC